MALVHAIAFITALSPPTSGWIRVDRTPDPRAATEPVVVAGLDWLVRHQDESGGWDADGFQGECEGDGARCEGVGKGQHGEEMPCPFDGAISALAALALLGHGHRPDAEGDALEQAAARALESLERTAKDTWTLPLALEAFAEAAAMCDDAHYRELALELGQSMLARRQQDGAFGYAAPYRPGSDVPYTALAITSLVAATDIGLELPEDFATEIDSYLTSLEESRGQLAYLVDGRRYGYTPTATNAHLAAAIRELLEVGRSGSRHRAHLALVNKQKPKWKISFRTVEVPGRGEVSVQVGHLSLYQWWYGTIASYQRGGSSWSSWYGAARRELTRVQRKDGCARGSFDPEGTYERQTGGRVFATALALLILEEPARHQRLTK